MKNSDKYTHTLTKPWHKDEYIYIDGKPYVYTGSWVESFLVRFPGGHVEYADMLLQRYGGNRVVYPFKPRLAQHTNSGVQNLNTREQ